MMTIWMQCGELPKKGRLEQFAGLSGDLTEKKRGGVFEGVVDTPMHNMFLPICKSRRII